MSADAVFQPDYAGAEVAMSPNFGMRRDARKPDALILHYTGMETGEGAQAWLCDPRSEVSSHYIVHEDGRIVQMVREADRAWHAGRGSWGGVDDVNSFSIGIEIVNAGPLHGFPGFPDAQIEAVIRLSGDICRRHRIFPHRVLAHSDTAPGRKIDPGERFPWHVLAAAGVGHYVLPVPVTPGKILQEGDRGAAVDGLRRMLARYGYDVEKEGSFDSSLSAVVQAFQRHFRPAQVDGVADLSTCETLRGLLDSLPDAENYSM